MGFSVKNAKGVYEIPFLDRMGFVFLFCIIGMYIISMFSNKAEAEAKGLAIDAKMFKTSNGFAVGALLVLGLLVALYSVYW